MNWIKSSDGVIPKDGTVIIRWHKAWKCPMAVKYSRLKEYKQMPWIEATLTHCWPEECFTEHWMPNIKAPE